MTDCGLCPVFSVCDPSMWVPAHCPKLLDVYQSGPLWTSHWKVQNSEAAKMDSLVPSRTAALLRKSRKGQTELEPAGSALGSLELASVCKVHYETSASTGEKHKVKRGWKEWKAIKWIKLHQKNEFSLCTKMATTCNICIAVSLI